MGWWGQAAQKIVAAYEAKAAELARETAGLRAALDHLQREHRRLLNQQARLPPARTPFTAKTTANCLAVTSLQTRHRMPRS